MGFEGLWLILQNMLTDQISIENNDDYLCDVKRQMINCYHYFVCYALFWKSKHRLISPIAVTAPHKKTSRFSFIITEVFGSSFLKMHQYID